MPFEVIGVEGHINVYFPTYAVAKGVEIADVIPPLFFLLGHILVTLTNFPVTACCAVNVEYECVYM